MRLRVARLFLRRQPRPPCLLPEPGGGLLCFCFFSTRQEGLGILRQQERKKADSKSNTTHSLSHKTHSHITNKVQTGLTRKSHKKCLNILKKSPAEPKSPCVPHFLLASKNLSLTFFSLLVCSLAAPHVSVVLLAAPCLAGCSIMRKEFHQNSLARHWARDWRALQLTQGQKKSAIRETLGAWRQSV